VSTPRPNKTCPVTLLLAKNDPRFGQIIGRELQRYFISWHDPDEMLAHFTGNMRKHIALARKIDTKHRARQHLSYRTFGYDLSFLRHRVEYTRRYALLNRQGQLSILSYALERNCRQVFAELLAFPPRASLSMLLRRCESIAI
jgi:hypothetical protein